MKDMYKIECTDKGLEVHQIIDGWTFVTVVPPSIPIIVLADKEEEK